MCVSVKRDSLLCIVVAFGSCSTTKLSPEVGCISGDNSGIYIDSCYIAIIVGISLLPFILVAELLQKESPGDGYRVLRGFDNSN